MNSLQQPLKYDGGWNGKINEERSVRFVTFDIKSIEQQLESFDCLLFYSDRSFKSIGEFDAGRTWDIWPESGEKVVQELRGRWSRAGLG